MSRNIATAKSRIAGKGTEGSAKKRRIGSRKAVCGRDDITLSAPGKMPSYGWSLPAGMACPASKITIKQHGDKAVCHVCYAKGGNYIFPNVVEALKGRMAFVVESLKTDNGDTFVRTMIDMVSRAVKETGPYFRIHDSGDFFHPMYVDCWRRICEALPDVNFWAPTREHLRPMMLPALRGLAALPNVTIRPSAAVIDEPAPMIDGLQAGSMVVSRQMLPVLQAAGQAICPATVSDNRTCAAHGCFDCWTKKAEPRAYAAH